MKNNRLDRPSLDYCRLNFVFYIDFLENRLFVVGFSVDRYLHFDPKYRSAFYVIEPPRP